MERMTLREAAERTSRSITTLRRYIRSGRLHAEKRYGRFGPEYFVSVPDLREAGLETEGPRLPARRATTAIGAAELVRADAVPLALYQELQMKHEQLLVQYGMMRAGGLRVLALQAEADARRQEAERAEASLRDVRQQSQRRVAGLERELREARLELEGRRLEIDALREKVRGLEMLTRNAVTTETIDEQFRKLVDQTRRVDGLNAASERGPRPDGVDH